MFNLQENGMAHTRGRPYHPQTQGKIGRWHRSMKNQSLLDKYYLPAELQEHLQHFVNYYNHERYHESLDNLTPADVFYGCGQAILGLRRKDKIKHLSRYDGKCITIISLVTQPDELKYPLNQDATCPTEFEDVQ